MKHEASPVVQSYIACGNAYNVTPGFEFLCHDYIENVYRHCVGTADWRYKCWDPVEQEWEWANYNEADGTPDNSLLTSIETDGLPGTSASVNVRDHYYEEASHVETSVGTSVASSEAVDMPENVQQNPTCGAYFNVAPGQEFFCYDPLTTIYHHCVGTNDWRYICWDAAGQEWEWGNYNEADGTPDNSLLTSIETDGLPGTSASVNVRDHYYEEASHVETSVGTSVASSS